MSTITISVRIVPDLRWKYLFLLRFTNCTRNERAVAAGGGVIREPWHHGLLACVVKVEATAVTHVINGQVH